MQHGCDAAFTGRPRKTFLVRFTFELELKQPLTAHMESHVPPSIASHGRDRSQIVLQPEAVWLAHRGAEGAGQPHLSSCRTRLFSRSLAALSSSLSGLTDRRAR